MVQQYRQSQDCDRFLWSSESACPVTLVNCWIGHRLNRRKGEGRSAPTGIRTLVIAENTPIVLAIEPVRDARGWEDKDNVHRTSRADVVDRLLEQAQQHVDINKVFADREFDANEVRHLINKHDLYYVIGKRKQSSEDKENIEEVEHHPVIDARVEYASSPLMEIRMT